VQAHVVANRREIAERAQATLDALGGDEATAFDLVPKVFGELGDTMMSWALTIMLCFLTHLERRDGWSALRRRTGSRSGGGRLLERKPALSADRIARVADDLFSV
jgi:hypothetical protein